MTEQRTIEQRTSDTQLAEQIELAQKLQAETPDWLRGICAHTAVSYVPGSNPSQWKCQCGMPFVALSREVPLREEIERLRAVLERVDRQLAGYAEFSPAAELHRLTHETLYGEHTNE